MTNIFEQASRRALRFESKVGLLSVEQLWTLPLTTIGGRVSLDSLAIELNKELKGSEESFVAETKKDAVTELKLEVVKHIIGVRVAENKAKTEEKQRTDKLATIDALIAKKRDEAMSELTLDELEELKKNI